MKPFIERLPVAEGNSFVANTHRTPLFEVSWHQHIEYEIILITEGSGMTFIGNYVGEFKVGDIFFIGSNVPHTFKKEGDVITSAVVIHFNSLFWGKEFLNLPENKLLNDLLGLSMKGIKLDNGTPALSKIIRKLEHRSGISRIISLLNCLDLIVKDERKTVLSVSEMPVVNERYQDRLDNIFSYTISNFQKPIMLSEIAAIANMSATAFCFYFKKSTKKKYVEFLNEIRIGHACKLLQTSGKPIIEICYESGFNTPANFNKQFIKIKKMPPSEFRSNFKQTTY
ncbi:MAG: AraC family transcriptional regulator [Flavobacterium sp.]|nr:AraC family transcriptional regulator [Flavobacterium sp.]